MAADTATETTAVPAATLAEALEATPIAPAPEVRGRFPTTDERRNVLERAFETRKAIAKGTTPELAVTTQNPPETPQVDTGGEKGDTETQQTGPSPEGTAPQETALAGEQPSKATTEGNPPSTETTPPAPAASLESALVEKSTKTTLPDEYQTAELESLYKADPLLKRAVNSLWIEPNLSPVAKVQKIEAKIAASKGKLQQAQAKVQEEDRLWDEGDYDTLRQRHLAKRDQRTLTVEAERTVTQLLAQAVGVDPDDEGFLNAGSEAQTNEERFRAFGDWIARNAPVVKEVLTEREAALVSQHQSEVATLKAQFEQEKKALTAKMVDQQATAVVQAQAQARAGNPPPRGVAALPTSVSVQNQIAPTLAERRELMSRGFAMREEARAN